MMILQSIPWFLGTPQTGPDGVFDSNDVGSGQSIVRATVMS